MLKAHIAIEPKTGLVTACALSKAAGPGSHDAEAAMDLLIDETEPVEVVGPRRQCLRCQAHRR